MKRFLSLLLCLVMCFSVFSVTAAEVYALGQAENIFSVESTGFENNRITYTISLAANQTNILGAVIKAKFDSTVLEVSDDSGAVGSVNSFGEFAANVTGYYETGVAYDDANTYAVAYMNPNGYSIGATGKQFIQFTFTATGETRPVTEVEFYCHEYITEDENDENDIRKGDGAQLIFSDSFLTLNPAANGEVASSEEGLKFTWIGATGAEWYNIYRKTVNSDWAFLTKVDAGVTEYIDASIDQGTEYYYSVESANQHGIREYDKTGLAGMYFGTITEIGTEITERGALVTWGALNGAENYSVYRKSDGEESWKKLATVEGTSYEDEPLTSGVEYSYTVKAHQGVYNAEASVDPAKITFVAVPTIQYYQLNYNDIVINWGLVDGAVGYEVYRKTADETEYTKIGTVEDNAYTDTDVADGETYSYKVRSVGANFSSVLGSVSYDLVKVPITTDVVASLGTDSVSVSWAPVDLAEEYIVWRKTDSGNWTEIATVTASQTKYTDNAVRSGTSYVYAVQTKANGLTTSLSDESNSAYYLDTPTVASVTNGSDGMEVSFNKVKGAEKYVIYRKEVNGQFAQIGTLDAAANALYVDTTSVSGVQYVYGVKAVYGDVESSVGESKVACCVEEPKIASVKNIYGGVEVKWNAVAGAEKYVVYYGLTRTLSAMTPVATVTGTSYTHKNAVSGRNNYYAVMAYCGDISSTMSQDVTFYLASPSIKTIENKSKNVVISWNEVAGADEYIVYRKAGSATSWGNPIYQGSKTTYTDTNVKSGTKYTYTVRAYDGEDYSAFKSSGWAIEYLSIPTLKSAANAYGGVKVTWSKVTGATKYTVYRKSGSSSWKSIGTTSSISYTDKTAKSGTTYKYTVKATDGSSASYYNTTGKSVQYVAAPVVKVSNTTSGVKLSWSKVGGATKYVIYRKVGSAKSWTKIKTTTSTSYTDKSAKNGKTYKYTVRAYKSSTASAYNTSGWKIRFITAPKLSRVSSAKSGITFKWNKVSGASGYYVYRKTGSGSYKKIATVKGSSKVSYLDKSAKKGKTYTYTVKAYYSSYTSAYRSGLKIKDKY